MRTDWLSLAMFVFLFVLTLFTVKLIRKQHDHCRERGFTGWQVTTDSCYTVERKASR